MNPRNRKLLILSQLRERVSRLRLFESSCCFRLVVLGQIGMAVLLIGCGSPGLRVDEMVDRAAALCDRGRGDEALLLLDQVLSQTSNQPRPYYLKGLAHELTQEYELAKQAYDKCLELNPEDSDALNNRGVVLARLGLLDQAIADLTQATRLNPADALAWSNLALAYHDLGEHQLAITNYEQAIQLGRNAQTLFQLGNIYAELKDYTQAEAWYSQALDLDPQNAHVFFNRARARIELKKHEQASEDLEFAKKFDSEQSLQGMINEAKLSMNRADQPSSVLMSHQSASSGIEVSEAIIETVTHWLASLGWTLEKSDHSQSTVYLLSRTHDESGQELASSSMPQPVLILTSSADGEVICNYDQASAVLQSKQAAALIVVDPQWAGSIHESNPESPAWLVHANFEWKPTRADFFTKTVILKNVLSASNEGPSPP